MRRLEGQKILLLCPKFFGYDIEIKDEMERLGAKVDLFDERPSESVWSKALIRVGLGRFLRLGEKHYENIIATIGTRSYQFILFVTPEALDRKSLLTIRRLNPDAKLILYTWDSFRNKKQQLKLVDYFDSCLTFDNRDAEVLTKFQFRPLFFSRAFKSTPVKSFKYDLLFYGTIHSDRSSLLKKIERICDEKSFKLYSFKYCPSKIIFFIRKIFDPRFSGTSIKEVAFKPMSKSTLVELASISKCLLDIHHPRQVGLTIRTMEAIGTGKKLLTTNREIMNYDFYNPSNIAVIDRKNVIIDESFFAQPYQDISDQVKWNYTLEKWVHDVLFGQ